MIKTEQEFKDFEYDEQTGILTRIRRNMFGRSHAVKQVVGTKNQHGYIVTRFQNKMIAIHRLIWGIKTGKLPSRKYDINHINGIKDDNRWCNLRLATRGQNNMNSGNPVNNTSGQKGVHPTRGRWYSRIKVDGKIIHLGVFENFNDAVNARKDAEIKYFGEFVRT